MSESRQGTGAVLFSDTESPSAAERLPVHRVALGSFLIGSLSWLAAFHPALWLVPAIGIVLSLAAWRAVSGGALSGGEAERRFRGRRLALVGLALSVFFLAYAPVRQVSRQQRLYAEAERVSREWLTLVCQGQLREAHQLRLRYDLRTPGDQPLDEFYKKPEQQQDLQKFRQDEVVKQLWGTGEIVLKPSDSTAPPPKITLFANRSATTTVDGDDWIVQIFDVELSADSTSRKVPVHLETLRLPMNLTSEGIWMVREAIIRKNKSS
ncbi:MAG: hypothetical protein ACKPEY_05465 [Planctomycetota bacterium]